MRYEVVLIILVIALSIFIDYKKRWGLFRNRK